MLSIATLGHQYHCQKHSGQKSSWLWWPVSLHFSNANKAAIPTKSLTIIIQIKHNGRRI